MQYPTKAICPILLEDFRRITVDRKGDSNFFTSNMIKACMKKGRVTPPPPPLSSPLLFGYIENYHRNRYLFNIHVTVYGYLIKTIVVAVNIHQSVYVDDELEIKAFYGGHVCIYIYYYIQQ